MMKRSLLPVSFAALALTGLSLAGCNRGGEEKKPDAKAAPAAAKSKSAWGVIDEAA